MRKLHLIPLAAIMISLIGCTTNETPSEEPLPNIVLIVADDLGYPYAGFMGDTLVLTPALDKLAGLGTVFTNGMVTQSHCAPSLRTIITGLHSARYNYLSRKIQNEVRAEQTVGLNKEDSTIWESEFQWRAMPYFNTIPEFLSEKGYASFQGGKWWEYNYQNGGFDDGMSTGWTKEDRQESDFFYDLMGGKGLDLGRVTNQPVFDFIEANSEKPFFVWWAPDLPHYPFNAADEYYNIYSSLDISESAKRYYANISWFDDALADMMSYFEQQELMENTLFIYVNDNGWDQEPTVEYRNDSLLWHTGGPKGKGSYYDMTFRTPLIFSWKGQTEPKYNEELVSSMDILPTILDYVGLEKPDYMPGMSLRENIGAVTTDGYEALMGDIIQLYDYEDSTFFMGKPAEGFWLRTPKYHYVWDITHDEELLFDMENDPENNNNIAYANQELIATFKDKLVRWKKEQEVSLKEGELDD